MEQLSSKTALFKKCFSKKSSLSLAVVGDSTGRQIFNSITTYFDKNLPFAYPDAFAKSVKDGVQAARSDPHNFSPTFPNLIKDGGKFEKGFRNFTIGSLDKILYYFSRAFNEPDWVNQECQSPPTLQIGLYAALEEVEKYQIEILIVGSQIYHPLSFYALCTNNVRCWVGQKFVSKFYTVQNLITFFQLQMGTEI